MVYFRPKMFWSEITIFHLNAKATFMIIFEPWNFWFVKIRRFIFKLWFVGHKLWRLIFEFENKKPNCSPQNPSFSSTEHFITSHESSQGISSQTGQPVSGISQVGYHGARGGTQGSPILNQNPMLGSQPNSHAQTNTHVHQLTNQSSFFDSQNVTSSTHQVLKARII